MIIRLSTGDVSVDDADTLTDLRVATAIEDPSTLAEAVRATALGTADGGDHVLVDVARLRALGRARATLADWDDRFDAMLAYAEGRGWVGAGGDTVRAHVEHRAD